LISKTCTNRAYDHFSEKKPRYTEGAQGKEEGYLYGMQFVLASQGPSVYYLPMDKKLLDKTREEQAPAWFAELKRDLSTKSKRELVRLLAETLVMFTQARTELEELKRVKSEGTSSSIESDNAANQQRHPENQDPGPGSASAPS
jgi:hypothetical protein